MRNTVAIDKVGRLVLPNAFVTNCACKRAMMFLWRLSQTPSPCARYVRTRSAKGTRNVGLSGKAYQRIGLPTWLTASEKAYSRIEAAVARGKIYFVSARAT
jgi:hypothetical protein